MNKENYIKIINTKINNPNTRNIMIKQIDTYNKVSKEIIDNKKYSIGDRVFLKKGTLLHGTYKNIEGLQYIVENGLISSWFIDGRGSKYPSSVGVWNLTKDYYLDEYIDFYSGGTIRFREENKEEYTQVIPYSNMKNIMDIIKEKDYFMWEIEQTKEARFMPNNLQDKVQIAIIFKNNKELLKGDILEESNINDIDVKELVNDKYYEQFIIDRKNKNDFFTNRESAILFGIPSNLIEGILVGKSYEKDPNILKRIKELLPNAYICNLKGIVIY